jgi:hypothetical protein
MRHSRSVREALALGMITVAMDYTDASDFVAQVELSGFSGASNFGNQEQFASSEVESQTISSAWQPKAILNTGVLNGTYWIEYAAEIRNDVTSSDTEVRLRNITDAETLNLSHIEPHDQINWYSISGFAEFTTFMSSKTFEIQFRNVGVGAARIRRARIRIWRAS